MMEQAEGSYACSALPELPAPCPEAEHCTYHSSPDGGTPEAPSPDPDPSHALPLHIAPPLPLHEALTVSCSEFELDLKFEPRQRDTAPPLRQTQQIEIEFQLLDLSDGEEKEDRGQAEGEGGEEDPVAPVSPTAAPPPAPEPGPEPAQQLQGLLDSPSPVRAKGLSRGTTPTAAVARTPRFIPAAHGAVSAGHSPSSAVQPQRSSGSPSVSTLSFTHDGTFDLCGVGLDEGDDMGQEYRALYDRYLDLESQCRALESENTALLEDTKEVQTRSHKRKRAIEGLQANDRWFESRVGTLEVELQEAEDRYTKCYYSAADKLRNAREELDQKDKAIAGLRSTAVLKKAELEETMQALAAAKQRLAAADQAYSTDAAELVRTRRQIECERQDAARLAASVEEMGVALDGTLQHMEHVEQQLQEQQDPCHLRVLEAEYCLARAQLEERNTRLAALKAQREREAKERERLHKLLVAVLGQHGVTPAADLEGSVELLAGVMATKVHEVAELMGYCSRLLDQSGAPSIGAEARTGADASP